MRSCEPVNKSNSSYRLEYETATCITSAALACDCEHIIERTMRAVDQRDRQFGCGLGSPRSIRLSYGTAEPAKQRVAATWGLHSRVGPNRQSLAPVGDRAMQAATAPLKALWGKARNSTSTRHEATSLHRCRPGAALRATPTLDLRARLSFILCSILSFGTSAHWAGRALRFRSY